MTLGRIQLQPFKVPEDTFANPVICPQGEFLRISCPAEDFTANFKTINIQRIFRYFCCYPRNCWNNFGSARYFGFGKFNRHLWFLCDQLFLDHICHWSSTNKNRLPRNLSFFYGHFTKLPLNLLKSHIFTQCFQSGIAEPGPRTSWFLVRPCNLFNDLYILLFNKSYKDYP